MFSLSNDKRFLRYNHLYRRRTKDIRPQSRPCKLLDLLPEKARKNPLSQLMMIIIKSHNTDIILDRQYRPWYQRQPCCDEGLSQGLLHDRYLL